MDKREPTKAELDEISEIVKREVHKKFPDLDLRDIKTIGILKPDPVGDPGHNDCSCPSCSGLLESAKTPEELEQLSLKILDWFHRLGPKTVGAIFARLLSTIESERSMAEVTFFKLVHRVMMGVMYKYAEKVLEREMGKE